METILITCSKDKAVVQDENGRFLNRVSNGILVEKGDLCSIEQIAINSVGVGSDIIEIPRELGDYDFYTNEVVVKGAFYIHHNYEFSLQLPTIQSTQGGILATSFNYIYPYEAGGGGVILEQPRYGYMSGDAPQNSGARPDSNFQLLKTTIPKVDAIKSAGKRFWFITPKSNFPFDETAGISAIPTSSIYDFITTEIPLSVDVGYDSPSNIAGKLTEDLHSTLLHPLETPLDGDIATQDAPYELNNNNYVATQLQSVSSADGCIAVLGANFTRKTPLNTAPGEPTGMTEQSQMYECIAVLNPFLWIWGSRLLQGDGTTNFNPVPFPATPLAGMGYKNNYLIRGGINPILTDYTKDTYAIYNLYNLPRLTDNVPVPAVVYNSFKQGYILITNLCWTTPNVQNVAHLIHSQLNYEGEGTTTSQMNSPEERKNWIYQLPFGRCKDDANYLTPEITPALKPLLQTDVVSPLGGYGAGFIANAPEIPVQGFFNPVVYNKAYLGADDTTDGCEIANYKFIDDVYNDSYDPAFPLNPLEAAKYYNANIIAVSNPKEGGQLYNKEVYIGIICNDYQVSTAVPPVAPAIVGTLIEKANYCMVDLAARNRKNPIVVAMNPNLKAAEGTGVVPVFDPTTSITIPAYTTTTPQPDLVENFPEVPAYSTSTPQPDLVENFPEVPESYDLQNTGMDGSVAMVSDFDVANNAIPMVLNGGQKQFVDDGGTASDYSTSHFRHSTFDAGAGNAVWISFIKYAFEASSYSHYDRLYITASDTIAGLSTSAGLLNSTKAPGLSPKLYQTTSTAVSTGLGDSITSSNGGYGSGGGWVVPTESGEAGVNDMQGNNNASWLNTFYKINTRYVRCWFFSDGSATDTGWEIRVSPEIYTPLVPAYTTTTPQPDIVINYPLVPAYTTSTPQPDLVENFPEEIQENLGTDLVANYINTIQVGTPNPSIQFDSGRGRFNFQNLHWDRFEGNVRGTYTQTPQPDENAAADVIVNSLNAVIPYFDNFVVIEQAKIIVMVCANSGIGLYDFGLYQKNSTGEVDYLTQYRTEVKNEMWGNSLLARLGFDWEALLNPLGLPDVWFLTRTYETSTITKLVQYFPYPLTTNSVLDSTLAFAYDQTNTINPYPMYNLSSQSGRWNVNASTSTAAIFASNLPQKLVFPFWLIYSDMIGGITFHSSRNGAQSNIIAICNRSYTSGDFAYSFATDYVFTATKDFVITSITTQVLNPDLTPANINDRTTIVYKIQKPLKMFQNPPPPPNEDEAKLKQRTGR